MKSRLAQKIMKHRFADWDERRDLRSYYYLFGNMKLKNLNPYWGKRWRVYGLNDILNPDKVDDRIIRASRMYLWSKPSSKWMQTRKRRQDKIREQRRKEYEQEAETFYKEMKKKYAGKEEIPFGKNLPLWLKREMEKRNIDNGK